MGYKGRVVTNTADIQRQTITGSTSATHTLTTAAKSEQQIQLYINGVKQHDSAYTLSNDTTLVLASALVATDEMEIITFVDVGTTTIPSDGSVTTVKIGDDAVTADKLASGLANATHTGDVTGSTALTIAVDAVDIPMLSATGTADATTFLRGDNAWASAGGGKVLQFVEANYETEQTTTSATFEDLDNPQPSITLSDSSNKGLVWGCLGGVYKNPDGTGSNDMSLVFQLLRDSSVIQALGDKICNIYGSGNDGNLGIGSLSWTYLDAPGDTSSHTYKVQWKRSSDDGATIGSVSRGGAYSSIILLEIET